MATKTFKIGLSNTDKQNMAQDVYERLLALTFPEYDTDETYAVGDFVVYNDQLYKCIGATSGAWDSTKWQLATLNDLLTDIESAVAFVNDKANVDGNYPTMTVGVADQLSPYDDESGDDQDEPFSFQATGTGNGSQPDFATGSIALMKEKQGNSVVVNQLVSLGRTKVTVTVTQEDVDKETNWLDNLYSTNLKNNYQTDRSYQGHKCWVYVKINSNYLYLGWGSNSNNILTNSRSTQGSGIAVITAPTLNANQVALRKLPTGLTPGDYSIEFYFTDLTQWFNGDIPQDLLDHPENFFRYYQGSLAYNTGELVNANGRYIKCIGRQQWDEVWELGDIASNNGNNSESSSKIRSKNFIEVIPNRQYYFYAPSNLSLRYYDKDKNYLGNTDKNEEGNGHNVIRTIPSNCKYVRFVMTTTTYANNITISLYYEDESGYDQYYPYEVLTNNDTGTEVLRSAGNAHDVKLPNGEIKRRIGVVDLGSLSWTYNSNYGMYSGIIQDAKAPATNNEKANIVCPIRETAPYSGSGGVYGSGTSGNKIALVESKQITINTTETDAATFKASLSGVYLFYELAEPTTEQGTTFSPNLIIDDFGSMSFEGTNGVPQGNLIFYPVDYKAFIDTLYNYTEGTPSNIALKSDLPTAPQTFLESISGYDATKTQTLKNVEGTLTWVDDE